MATAKAGHNLVLLATTTSDGPIAHSHHPPADPPARDPIGRHHLALLPLNNGTVEFGQLRLNWRFRQTAADPEVLHHEAMAQLQEVFMLAGGEDGVGLQRQSDGRRLLQCGG